MKSIILTGIKHCGKSTQARLVSRELNLESYDTDDVIKEITGRTPRQIYVSDGAEGFMKAEKEACLELEKRLDGKAAVIATGGGICNNPAALEILRRTGTIVFIDVDEETACDRIIDEIVIDVEGMKNLPAYIAAKNPENLDDVRKIFHDFYTERRKVYSQLADVTISAEKKSKAKNCEMIISTIKSRS
ncbi:MAG: shikimate kinase [Treponema sp.]|nr:shikimate kinase [Treponema sp.]